MVLCEEEENRDVMKSLKSTSTASTIYLELHIPPCTSISLGTLLPNSHPWRLPTKSSSSSPDGGQLMAIAGAKRLAARGSPSFIEERSISPSEI